jgi:hypothetical protein
MIRSSFNLYREHSRNFCGKVGGQLADLFFQLCVYPQTVKENRLFALFHLSRHSGAAFFRVYLFGDSAAFVYISLLDFAPQPLNVAGQRVFA